MKISPSLSATAAALVYGSWAMYANSEYALDIWIRAGVIQASYAFLSTLSITKVAQFVYYKRQGGIGGFVSGFATGAAVMVIIPLAVHTLSGTPDILQTITPGVAIGSLYLLIFLSSLYRPETALSSGSTTSS